MLAGFLVCAAGRASSYELSFSTAVLGLSLVLQLSLGSCSQCRLWSSCSVWRGNCGWKKVSSGEKSASGKRMKGEVSGDSTAVSGVPVQGFSWLLKLRAEGGMKSSSQFQLLCACMCASRMRDKVLCASSSLLHPGRVTLGHCLRHGQIPSSFPAPSPLLSARCRHGTPWLVLLEHSAQPLLPLSGSVTSLSIRVRCELSYPVTLSGRALVPSPMINK